MTEETQAPVSAEPKESQFHAVLKSGQIVQHTSRKGFEKAMERYSPDDVVLAVKGAELKPSVKLTF